MPEIIGFSNRIAYEPENIRLVPVRQFGADRLQPVKAVHVVTGYETGSTGSKINRPEAEALADQIAACLADPSYEGRTFGVISLLGPTQAKLINNLLLDRVSPEDWAAHDLRCGDAAAFQGSERDIMFLSMVSAPDPGQRAATRTDLASIQRYNVAASRAKDQMWVFHSVALGQLTNPDDLRYQLLDYCYNAVPNLRLAEEGTASGLVPEDQRVGPFDSLFEQRVHNRLVERGYTVIPQYPSMGYRIDLAVVGAKTMLAVECDGDFWHGPDQYLADLARERDLRRCGWQFFRIRESAFYVDPHSSMSRLWSTLDELGIRPAGYVEQVEPEPSFDADPVPAEADDPARLAVLELDALTIARSPRPSESVPAHDGVDEGNEIPMPQPVAPTIAPPTARDSRTPPQAVTSIEHERPTGRRFADDPAPNGFVLEPYRTYTGWAPAVGAASRKDIELTLLDIVEAEGPVLGTRAQTAYVSASGGHRVGHVIADELDAALARLVRSGRLVTDDSHNGRIRNRTFRLPAQESVIPRELGPRDLDEVPPRELAAVLREAARRVGWRDEPLLREALRMLGRSRLTAGVQQSFASVLPLALAGDHETEEGATS